MTAASGFAELGAGKVRCDLVRVVRGKGGDWHERHTFSEVREATSTIESTFL